jgi:hypothetical protein
MEQRAIIAESAKSEVVQKYTAVEQESKQRASLLENVTHELEFKKQKIAVLEARVGGVAMPDFKPPAKGHRLSEKEEVGGTISKMKNSFRKNNSFTSDNVGNKTTATSSTTSSATTTATTAAATTEKKGFWANLLYRANQDSANKAGGEKSSEMKEEPEPEQPVAKSNIRKVYIDRMIDRMIDRDGGSNF